VNTHQLYKLDAHFDRSRKLEAQEQLPVAGDLGLAQDHALDLPYKEAQLRRALEELAQDLLVTVERSVFVFRVHGSHLLHAGSEQRKTLAPLRTDCRRRRRHLVQPGEADVRTQYRQLCELGSDLC